MTSLTPTFYKKLNLFNEFFRKQCQPLQNNSTLPKSNTYQTENRLNDITFDNEKLLKIIQSLDATKAHGYDGISIRMLKLISPSIIKPLSTIFQNCMNLEISLMTGKKETLYRSIKKIVNNYSVIIAQCYCYLHVQNFLRSSYSIVFIVS